MGYLRQADYNLLIQPNILSQLLGNPANIQKQAQAEALAQEEIYSKLKQRYNLDIEFTPTLPYNYTTAYQAAQRVELNFPAYSASSTYALNSLVVNSGQAYICTTAIVSPEAFNPAHWQLLGNQYDIYNAVFPKPLFDYTKYYNAGDQVYWNGKTYTCLIPTEPIYHTQAIQANSYDDIPLINVFPDDPINGITYWGTGTTYNVPAGTLPTNITYWALGDNRSQQIVQYMVMIVLYYLSRAIAPKNIPQERIEDYNLAIRFLENIAHGIDNANLYEQQPQGQIPIKGGSQVKRNNQW